MMIAYKGFKKDLTCRGYQFKEDEWNIEPEANCVQNGFHCASNPLDCLSYYPNMENSVYYMVLVDGDVDEDGVDSKISCTRMKLLQKMSVEQFVYESLMYLENYPNVKNNNRICENVGIATNEFVIVRGKNPIAKGKKGSCIGLAKERADSHEIMEMGLYRIDGKQFLEDTFYTIRGSIAEEEVEQK